MTVIETILATEPREPPPKMVRAAIRVLKLVIPLANPDFEDRYPNVTKWWVEIDGAGVPQRELGFDAAGKAIVAGPFGRNFGFWTDSPNVFEANEYSAVPSDLFESAWSVFESSQTPEFPKGS
jgi:hypothetical protein